MTIEALLNILPPPAEPVEAFRGPWAAVEAEIGTPLPPDYKDFVRIYGCGEFLGFFRIAVPWSWYPESRLAKQMSGVREILGDDADRPYPIWPEAGGLIACGETDFGDLFFWLTRGAPADWPMVFWDRGFDRFEVFDCGLTDFLAGVLTGRIQPQGFPEDALPYEPLFDPVEDGRPL